MVTVELDRMRIKVTAAAKLTLHYLYFTLSLFLRMSLDMSFIPSGFFRDLLLNNPTRMHPADCSFLPIPSEEMVDEAREAQEMQLSA